MQKITAFTLIRSSLPLKEPFTTALRSVDAIHEIILVILTNNEQTGLGSAPETTAITGSTLQQIEYELREVVEVAFLGHPIDDLSTSLALLERLRICDSTKACVDIALHDLYAKQKKLALFEYLGGTAREMTTLYTISVQSPELMLAQAKDAYLRGFTRLKVKLDADNEANIARLFLLATHLPKAALYLDLNQALSADETLYLISNIEALNIKLIEQPVKASDLEGLTKVTQNAPFPILADESVFTLKEAQDIIQNKRASYINIKLMKCGGIAKASAIIAYAKEHDVQCMMGSMLESSLSVTAALHLAYCYDNVLFLDLDGPTLAQTDPYDGGITYTQEHVSLNMLDHGLGVLF